MKKNFCLLLLCLLLSMIVSSQIVTIRGNITDVDTMMVLIRRMDKCDTVFTTTGKFTFSRKLLLPELFTIVCVKNKQSIDALKEGNERKMRSIEDGAYQEFFLENGELILNTTFSNIKNTKSVLTKHLVQDKYDEFKTRFNPLVKMARTIIDSSYTMKAGGAEKKIFDMLYQRIIQIENEVAEKFVTENAGNAVGAYVLYRYCRIENHYRLDSLYRLFNPALRSTAYLKNIEDKIKALAVLKPGESVPLFTSLSIDRSTISLSSLRGKYVVLDFWGSWCMPCISEFPKMKAYYEKYKNEVVFVGVACKDTETAWKAAIQKYDLAWLHVLNPGGVNDLSIKYNVEAYPTKVLIDKDGKLVQVFTGETEQFYQKLDSLFEKSTKN